MTYFDVMQKISRKVQGVLTLIYQHWMRPLHFLKQRRRPNFLLVVWVMSKLHVLTAVLRVNMSSVLFILIVCIGILDKFGFIYIWQLQLLFLDPLPLRITWRFFSLVSFANKSCLILHTLLFRFYIYCSVLYMWYFLFIIKSNSFPFSAHSSSFASCYFSFCCF